MSNSMPLRKSSRFMKSLAVFALVFGLMTIVSGGGVLFGPDTARAQAGAYLPFVVWFNFFAGFVYMFAGVCIWREKALANTLATLIAVSSGLIAVIFAGFVLSGADFEMRTVGALVLRTGVWAAIAIALFASTKRQSHA